MAEINIKNKIKQIFNTNSIDDESHEKIKLPKKNVEDCDSYLKLKIGVNKYKYVSVFEFSAPIGASHDFDEMWGIACIPKDYRTMGVDITLVDSTGLYSDIWVAKHRDAAEAAVTINQNTQSEDGTITEYEKAMNAVNDVASTANELIAGAVYMDTVHYLIMSSDSLENIKQVKTLLVQDIGRTLGAVDINQLPMIQMYAMQSIARGGLTGLPKARAAHWSMSSMMYGGYYNYLSKSILDKSGEYLGNRFNDLSTAPVIFDFDLFTGGAVIVDSSLYQHGEKNIKMSDYLAARLETNCLCEQHRIVHINITDSPLLSSEVYKDISTIINENNRINPFEIFGTKETELADFSSHIEKMKLFFKQLVGDDPEMLAIMSGNLGGLLTEFYIDQGMWSADAKNNRDRLRVIGIPHEQTPQLRDFIPYLEERYKAATSARSADSKQISALNLLRLTFSNLLDVNGDIFDTITSDVFDSHSSSHLITFDLARLKQRSTNVAMAQLVNVLNTACSNVREGDILMIHGAENMPEDVFNFVYEKLLDLNSRQARYVLVYNRLCDTALQAIPKSDYTIFGKLTAQDIMSVEESLDTQFQTVLRESLPSLRANQIFIKRQLGGYINQALCDMDMSDLSLYTSQKSNISKKKKREVTA